MVVGGVDSGVPNGSLAGACTINDHVLDTEEWPDHGQFVRHVTEVGKRLVAADVITGRQRSAIIRAAARSGVGR